MKKLIAAALLSGALFLLPTAANAATGYVCRVQHYNYTGFGNNGGILISFYSQPNCAGSLQFTGYACTAQSYDAVCSATSHYVYSELQLMTLFQALIGAGREGNRMGYSTNNSCRNSGTACLQNIDFYSN